MEAEKEFERLFKDCYTQFYAFAIEMVKEDEVCRDILSDSFEQLWRHINEVEVSRRKSYVYRIIRNKCVDRVRGFVTRQRYEVFFRTVYGDEASDDGTLLQETEERIGRMYDVMGELTPQTRHVLEECYFNDKRYVDVAAELGISVSAVRKHIVKALKHLRERVPSKN